MINELKQ